MKATFKHVNIIARNWRALANFYEEVFGCVLVPPERNLSGSWLTRGTGVPNAKLEGSHLRLPGYGEDGPTLEIYQYSKNEPRYALTANREGITHLAFEVDDVQQSMAEVLKHGGSKVGEIATSEVAGVGRISFVYLADPEGNIIELQAWS